MRNATRTGAFARCIVVPPKLYGTRVPPQQIIVVIGETSNKFAGGPIIDRVSEVNFIMMELKRILGKMKVGRCEVRFCFIIRQSN